MDYVRIARLDHWIKNLFILPGFAVAVLMLKPRPALDAGLWIDLAVALLATSLAASANYVINEWLDARFDRFHPTKKHRPVVVSAVKFGYVMVEYAALAVASLILSLLINAYFTLTIVWLLVMGIIYNVEPSAQRTPFLDVLSDRQQHDPHAAGVVCSNGGSHAAQQHPAGILDGRSLPDGGQALLGIPHDRRPCAGR